ncbi:MAG: hypothetical protein ACKO5J_09390 [Rubrivivax sp.]
MQQRSSPGVNGRARKLYESLGLRVLSGLPERFVRDLGRLLEA